MKQSFVAVYITPFKKTFSRKSFNRAERIAIPRPFKNVVSFKYYFLSVGEYVYIYIVRGGRYSSLKTAPQFLATWTYMNHLLVESWDAFKVSACDIISDRSVKTKLPPLITIDGNYLFSITTK